MLVDFRLKQVTALLERSCAAEQAVSQAIVSLVGNTVDEQRQFMTWYLDSAVEIAAMADEIDEHNGILVLNYDVIAAVVASEVSFREKFTFFVRGYRSALGGYFCWTQGFFGDDTETTPFVSQLRTLTNTQKTWLLWSLLLSGNQYVLALEYVVAEIDWGPLEAVVKTGAYALNENPVDYAADYYRALLAFALQHKFLDLEPVE